MAEEKDARLMTPGSEKTSGLLRELGCPFFDVRPLKTRSTLSEDGKRLYETGVCCKITGRYCVGYVGGAPITEATVDKRVVRRCPDYNKIQQ